jgi:hypothetical protein
MREPVGSKVRSSRKRTRASSVTRFSAAFYSSHGLVEQSHMAMVLRVGNRQGFRNQGYFIFGHLESAPNAGPELADAAYNFG